MKLSFATGSKLFIPSEWFTPAKGQIEGCSGPAAPAAAPIPATSPTPATH